ncbi:MAG TPA: hypothetical protein DEH78_33420 [Solibacterales bacterium]|nr:hypothetical protein [Bryobacterales bacterium]
MRTLCAVTFLCLPAAANWDSIGAEKAKARRAAVELGTLANDLLNISWESQALRLNQIESSIHRIGAALDTLERLPLATFERAAADQVRREVAPIADSLSSLIASVAANRSYIRHPEYRSRLTALLEEVYSAHRDVVAAIATADGRSASQRKGA